MSKRGRRLRNIAIGIAALIIAIVIATLTVVRTEGFRNYVTRKIIASTEDSTGGRVEAGSIVFDGPFHAIATNFVIHGKEPAGSAPFLRAKRIELRIRLLTSLRHLVDVSYLAIDGLEASVQILSDGQMNVPTPKTASNTTALETVVDLAVGHFDLTNGSFTLNSQKQSVNVHGNNLRAQHSTSFSRWARLW